MVNLRNISDLADHLVIATASSKPHLKAMSEHVMFELKKKGTSCARRSGDSESGWIALDYHDVIIHLFLAEKREYYSLEDFWANAANATKRTRGKSSRTKSRGRTE